MSPRKLIVQKYMTHIPIKTEATDSIDQVELLMDTHRIRHIPVYSGVNVVGVISDRDVQLARSAWRNSKGRPTANEIMTQELLEVSPLDTLATVAKQMEAQKVGSAIVKDGGILVGIFTTTDALRALKEVCS